MSGAWREFSEEIARWRDAGREVDFWLRDDDATRPNPMLERLLRLCTPAGVPLALAVIPEGADTALPGALGEQVTVLQHGTDHRNRASGGEKKTEYPEQEPAAAALARLQAGREALHSLAGKRFLPVLAPPWNRFPPRLAPRLHDAGYRGLSCYGARVAPDAAPGVKQVNAHVDVVDWRGTGGFAGERETLGLAVRHLAARRSGAADAGEPTGWLTHHARHDEAAWRFLERLFETTRGMPGVRWRSAAELFGTG